MMVWWGSWTRAKWVDLFTWPKEEKKSRPGLFLPAFMFMFLWASVYRREGERLFARAQMPSTGRKVFQMSVEMPKQNARNPLFPLLDEAPRNWLIPLCKLNLAHHPLARQLHIFFGTFVRVLVYLIFKRNNHWSFVFYLFRYTTDRFQALIQYPDVVTAQAAKLV